MADENSINPPRTNNALLDRLPQYDYDHAEPYLRRISMGFMEVLHEQGEPIRDVIFPRGAVCSLVKNMHDGQVVEVGTIGREGAVGTTVLSGSVASMNESLVKVTGGEGDNYGYAMPVEAFLDEMNEHGAFALAIMRFSYALMCQVAQTAVCNAVHSHEQRGCRWLLMTHDRAGRDAFQLTGDLFGVMLGITRSSVMLVTDGLQRGGLIHLHDGTVTILNRVGLEEAACECYEHVAKAYAGLSV